MMETEKHLRYIYGELMTLELQFILISSVHMKFPVSCACVPAEHYYSGKPWLEHNLAAAETKACQLRRAIILPLAARYNPQEPTKRLQKSRYQHFM